MGRFSVFLHSVAHCKAPLLHLASVWLLGLISGAAAAVSCDGSAVLIPETFLTQTPGFATLLPVTLLPLILAVSTAYMSVPVLRLPIAFGEGFLFTFAAVFITGAYGDAGWLVCTLVMFSGIMTLPVFWYLLSTPDKPRFWHRAAASAVAVTLICCADCYIISPFLASLI